MIVASATPSDRIATLLAWCADNGIKVDPRLEIRETEDNSIAVFAVDTVIGNPVALVQIPKSAVLSVRSCSLSHRIDAVPHGHDAHLSLALAMYAEILMGETSRWFGYLQSLPQELVDIALFWGHDVHWTNVCMTDGIGLSAEDQHSHQRDLDSTEALAWLRGTELQKQLRGSRDVAASLLDEVRDYFFTTVVPLLSRLGFNDHQTPNLRSFYRAYSLVSSRAFLVDAYHGLAMIPIADAFNHGQENHVHLESEYDVCNICGSACECVHDEEELDNHEDLAMPVTTTAIEEEGKTLVDDYYYDMMTNAPILAGNEVFNTYGEKLGNAQLLARYGFALGGNEHDCITWDIEEFDSIIGDKDAGNRVAKLCAQLVEEWSAEWEGLADSMLVYNSEVGQDSARGRARVFCLNEEGKITHELWLYCALLGLERDWQGTETRPHEEVVKIFRDAVDLQVMLEKEAEKRMTDVEEEVAGGVTMLSQCFGSGVRSASSSPRVVMGAIESVLSLCKARKGRLGKPGADLGSLGDAVDVRV